MILSDDDSAQQTMPSENVTPQAPVIVNEADLNGIPPRTVNEFIGRTVVGTASKEGVATTTEKTLTPGGGWLSMPDPI
ncbi:MAG: hypothetical protein JNM20_11050 [Rhizobiales bacterium]|nr:hypothetical protein [Hyphomicrobiales bacterium]